MDDSALSVHERNVTKLKAKTELDPCVRSDVLLKSATFSTAQQSAQYYNSQAYF